MRPEIRPLDLYAALAEAAGDTIPALLTFRLTRVFPMNRQKVLLRKIKMKVKDLKQVK